MLVLEIPIKKTFDPYPSVQMSNECPHCIAASPDAWKQRVTAANCEEVFAADLVQSPLPSQQFSCDSVKTTIINKVLGLIANAGELEKKATVAAVEHFLSFDEVHLNSFLGPDYHLVTDEATFTLSHNEREFPVFLHEEYDSTVVEYVLGLLNDQKLRYLAPRAGHDSYCRPGNLEDMIATTIVHTHARNSYHAFTMYCICSFRNILRTHHHTYIYNRQGFMATTPQHSMNTRLLEIFRLSCL